MWRVGLHHKLNWCLPASAIVRSAQPLDAVYLFWCMAAEVCACVFITTCVVASPGMGAAVHKSMSLVLDIIHPPPHFLSVTQAS